MNSKEEVIHVIERLDDFCIHGAKMSASIVQTGVRKSYRCHKGRVPIQDEISHHLGSMFGRTIDCGRGGWMASEEMGLVAGEGSPTKAFVVGMLIEAIDHNGLQLGQYKVYNVGENKFLTCITN
ncbi:hypothetical protein V6N12_073586 [Hibiscus sabdariffa]|uniref:Uncharacterized protein n=1 Tax=Hibiscus sabdariffa TaxID=183260 RepID=A0ABR2BI14_9ROSI